MQSCSGHTRFQLNPRTNHHHSASRLATGQLWSALRPQFALGCRRSSPNLVHNLGTRSRRSSWTCETRNKTGVPSILNMVINAIFDDTIQLINGIAAANEGWESPHSLSEKPRYDRGCDSTRENVFYSQWLADTLLKDAVCCQVRKPWGKKIGNARNSHNSMMRTSSPRFCLWFVLMVVLFSRHPSQTRRVWKHVARKFCRQTRMWRGGVHEGCVNWWPIIAKGKQGRPQIT